MAGSIPWKLPGDLKYFKEVTTATSNPDKQNAVRALWSARPCHNEGLRALTLPCAKVIMGRKTWESIPAKFRPLAGRVNVVLTSNAEAAFEGALTATSLNGAVALLATGDHADKVESVFIIGGAAAYAEVPMADPSPAQAVGWCNFRLLGWHGRHSRRHFVRRST